jgi:hypothetical protein
MAALQLQFTLRTSPNVKTVHLLGSWDNYNGQLPLSSDNSVPGGWKGTFRFQGTTLIQGQRYWYYYIIDGYHVSHDPAQISTREPTTGRALNILDVPMVGSSGGIISLPKPSQEARRLSVNIPKGRPISPSNIRHPKPVKPNQTRHITEADYSPQTVEALTSRFSTTTIGSEVEYLSSSPPSSVGSSLSSRSGSTSPSSASSLSDYSSGSGRGRGYCTCERYGITRRGDRVKLDCGGTRCAYSSDGESSSCCSDEDGTYVQHSARRQGVIVRR